jgi:hypothetical protein
MSKTKGTPRMQELLKKVMGTDKTMTEDEALANLKPTEDAATQELVNAVQATVESVNVSLTEVATPAPSPKEEAAVKWEEAYNVTFDDDTKKFILHTIRYNDDGHCEYVKQEIFASGLPECSHRLNKMMLSKLMYTMSPAFRRK